MKTITTTLLILLITLSNSINAQTLQENFNPADFTAYLATNSSEIQNSEHSNNATTLVVSENAIGKLSTEKPPMKKGKVIAGSVITGSFGITGLALIAAGGIARSQSSYDEDYGFGDAVGKAGQALGTVSLGVGASIGIPLIVTGKNPRK